MAVTTNDDGLAIQAERAAALGSAVLHLFAAIAVPLLFTTSGIVRTTNIVVFAVIEALLCVASLVAFARVQSFRTQWFQRLSAAERVLAALNFAALAWSGSSVASDDSTKYLLTLILVALTGISAANSATFVRRRDAFLRTVAIIGTSQFIAFALAGEVVLALFTVVWCIAISGFSRVAHHRMQALTDLRHESDETARHDDLTGLLVRNAFVEELDHARGSQRPTALVLVDLDGFKAINDGFGHAAGDEVLRAVARRLREAFPAGSRLGRLGGDEFAALVPGADPDAAQRMVESALNLVALPVRHDGGDLYVGASAGWTRVTAEQDGAALMAEADAAMYHSKSSPTSATTGFDPAMRDALDRSLELRQRFRGVVRSGRIEFLAQPIVRPSDRTPIAVELLARWPSDDDETIGPAEFNRLADETGLAVELDRLALGAAADLLARWREHPVLGRLVVKANVSPLHLHNLVLERSVVELIPDHDLHRLGLEFIEDRLMALAPRHNDLLRKLKSMGVTISIDDFGTGYSSLAYLRDLPVSEVKIDRAFMTRIDRDPINQGIVRAIVELSSSLGLTTVAEGVETNDEIEAVAKLGISAVQGYLTGRPATFDQVSLQLGNSHA